MGRRGGGLGGQGYGWEDATAQAPHRRNHRAKIERGGAFTQLRAPSIYLRSNRLTTFFVSRLQLASPSARANRQKASYLKTEETSFSSRTPLSPVKATVDTSHLPSASGGGLAAPSPSPVSRVGAAATPRSELSAPRPGGTESSRRPLLSSLRPPLPCGTATPTFAPALFSPRRVAAAAAAAGGGGAGAGRRRWPGSPWRTVREAARRKSATTMMVSGPASRRLGGQGWGSRPEAAPGSAAADASGRRC